MDLDIPAWTAYALIVVISLYTAINQVQELLKNVPWCWAYIESYLLFAMFFALPILIFWGLDRVGAIHDSSLISAFIVAFTYQAIVNDQSTTKSSVVAAVFKPILDWTRSIPERLAERVQADDAEFAAAVANSIGADDGLLETLEDWVVHQTADLATLQLRLQEFLKEVPFPQGAVAGSIEARLWSKSKAQRLVLFVEPTLWVRIRFARLNLIPWRSVGRAIVRLDKTVRWLAPSLILLFLAWVVGSWIVEDPSASKTPRQYIAGSSASFRFDQVMPRYYSWRYLKPGNTLIDVQRALNDLSYGLDSEIPASREAMPPDPTKKAIKAVEDPTAQPKEVTPIDTSKPYATAFSAILEQKDLTVQQANDLMRALFFGRLNRQHMESACAAMRLLPGALRSKNGEVRALIDTTLKESAAIFWDPQRKENMPPLLQIDAQAKMVALERAAVAWTDYLNAHCAGVAIAAVKSVPDPVTIGEPAKPDFVLRDVNFDTDSRVLRSEASPLLEVIAARLQKQPDVHVEINGYTDSTGTRRHNLRLSEGRANSVRDFLLDRGIASDRLATHGFGADFPVASNDSDQGRAKNRRVELKLLGNPPTSNASAIISGQFLVV